MTREVPDLVILDLMLPGLNGLEVARQVARRSPGTQILFLSIHANASRNPKARGIETYFLNFASNPEAEAVAARENSASGRTMHSLPEIVRAIALNNKIDESRDFAEMVQKSMVRRLTTRNKLVRDLGVKQAAADGLVPGPRLQIAVSMLSQTGGPRGRRVPPGRTGGGGQPRPLGSRITRRCTGPGRRYSFCRSSATRCRPGR